jgi:hypothetical protein
MLPLIDKAVILSLIKLGHVENSFVAITPTENNPK